MFLKTSLLTLTVALAATLTACGSSNQGNSQLAARIDMPSGANNDIQTLQAWISSLSDQSIVIAANDSNPFGIRVNANTCTTISEYEVDCTESLRDLTRVHGEKSPLLHRLIVPKQLLNANYSMSCRKVELRTVMKKSVFESPVMTGVGFYVDKLARQESSGLVLANVAGHEVWVAKADLHKVGETTLKSGEAAVVLRFIDASFCGMNGAFSSEFLAKGRYLFKPYVQYDVQEGQDVKVYKKWEGVQDNHMLNYGGSYSFDRAADLLQQ